MKSFEGNKQNEIVQYKLKVSRNEEITGHTAVNKNRRVRVLSIWQSMARNRK